MSYTYNFPMPALTVDIVLILGIHKALHILLIKRKQTSSKFPGYWALPGGYMNIDETLKEAAYRELKEETDIDAGKVWEGISFSSGQGLKFEFMQDEPNRDPPGRVISAVFSGLTYDDYMKPGDDAEDCCWCSVFNLPLLGFDHNEIINKIVGYDMCTNNKSLHVSQPTYKTTYDSD